MPVGTEGFVGQRLTEARESRGYSITNLVQLLEDVVTVAAVSQYEKGSSTPRPEITELLAEKLNFPSSFFLREAKTDDKSIVYWRSFNSATKTARTRAKRRFAWLKEITEYLKSFLEFPEVNFPGPKDFGVPKDPRGLSNQDLDDIADSVRRYWGLDQSPIENVIWLLENNGAVVSRASIYSDKLDAFSQFSIDGKVPYIFLATDKNSAVRSRLDAVHELAHLILHRHISEELFNDKENHALLERQAFYFGSAFLLPRKSFIEDFRYPTLNSFLYLKRIWKMSIGAMILRARDLGLIREDQSANLWINYARRGWRKQEPLDDTMQPEIPRLLKRSFEILINQKVKTPGQILQDLNLNSTDIEELSGLTKDFLLKAGNEIPIKIKDQII